MNEKDKIKLKIRALLSKTVENGATEAEAVSALSKANDLMLKYFISEHDLKDPFIGEKCVLKEIPIIYSGYDISIFYGYLSELFDCEHFYNHNRIAFFGFEQDTELCAYFYVVIIKACFREKDRYTKSCEYKKLKIRCHGRTLVSSFIKGFLIEISRKMKEMYVNRKSSIPQSMSLTIISKENRVKREFSECNFRLKTHTSQLKGEKSAFDAGVEKGKDFQIIQGINQYESESLLQLN
jgi:hypothetical protein